MRSEDCFFETARLRVADWHAQTDGADSLVEIVREMLTPDVTEQLPESWRGPYSVERAVNWIRDRDDEGTQLLALSSHTQAPVALLLLHEVAASAGGAEVRVNPFGTPSNLVRGGPFRYSRNPMYLAMLLILVGAAVAWGTLSPFIFPPLFGWLLTVRFIAMEEVKMVRIFGAEYEEYKSQVRRWL